MTAKPKSTLTSDAQNFRAPKKSHVDALSDLGEDIVDSCWTREVSLSAAAESSDDIDVTLQVEDMDGTTDVDAQLTFQAQVINTDGQLAADTEFRITAVGTGTAVSPGSGALDEPAAVIQTDAMGAAVFTVHDQAGASDQDVWVRIIFWEGRVQNAFIKLTFDAS